MDKATDAAFGELIRVVNFVMQTQDYGLKIAPLFKRYAKTSLEYDNLYRFGLGRRQREST